MTFKVGRPWTRPEDIRLRKLYKAGASFAAIGRAIGRNERVVRDRRQRLGLTRSFLPCTGCGAQVPQTEGKAPVPRCAACAKSATAKSKSEQNRRRWRAKQAEREPEPPPAVAAMPAHFSPYRYLNETESGMRLAGLQPHQIALVLAVQRGARAA